MRARPAVIRPDGLPQRRAGRPRAVLLLASVACVLAACTGAPWLLVAAPESAREHDARRFTVDETALRATLATQDAARRAGHGAFTPLDGLDTDRWVGVLGGAAYQVEVPRRWNGMLVMYAHGYRGTGAALTVAPPPIRRHLVEQGYAWAASSYSRNFYDVRAGVEDTNALARAFVAIARDNGRALDEPTRRFVIGHSMGGHVAAAAVERETLSRAVHRVRYDGAVPMCGVMGDMELFDGFAAYQAVAQHLAGVPATSWPPADWERLEPQLKARFFSPFPSGGTAGATTADGERLRQVVRHLSGGDRPGFDIAFTLPPSRGGYTHVVWGTFGRDGTVNGILDRDGVDTRRIVYRFDDDAKASAELDRAVRRVVGDPQANRMRRDGLRWIPTTPARIAVPVVTLHTLGDGYVWWEQQRIYRRRADAEGTSGWVVQRAIRGLGHCDFTLGEQQEAFDAMARWVATGRRPAGDDVLDAAATAAPTFGCRFTRPVRPEDGGVVRALRPLLPACPAGSASPGVDG